MGERLRKALYSHQRGYRSMAFLLVGAIAVGAYAVVVRLPDSSIPGWVLAARRDAVRTAIDGQQVVRDTRSAFGLPINRGDRFQTGMIGVASSKVTTELGALDSHRTAANPVFAAAVVQMLYEAGVQPGDLVAVGQTGSYPGLNLDVAAAIDAMGATPVTVSFIGSSAYGANEPKLTWADMEAALVDARVIDHRSAAVGAGGSLAGSSATVRQRLAESSGLPTLPVLPSGEAVRFVDRLYVHAANEAGKPIAAFVDVGGSSTIIGSAGAETIIPPGFSRPRWTTYQAARLGVVGKMALRGTPIVALMNVSALANQFGIPFDPHLAPSARDIAAPPSNPIAIAAALMLLLGLVVAMHRLGLFRVPRWEVPAALLRAARRPGATEPASAQDSETVDVAGDGASRNGKHHRRPAEVVVSVRNEEEST